MPICLWLKKKSDSQTLLNWKSLIVNPLLRWISWKGHARAGHKVWLLHNLPKAYPSCLKKTICSTDLVRFFPFFSDSLFSSLVMPLGFLTSKLPSCPLIQLSSEDFLTLTKCWRTSGSHHLGAWRDLELKSNGPFLQMRELLLLVRGAGRAQTTGVSAQGFNPKFHLFSGALNHPQQSDTSTFCCTSSSWLLVQA